jgi:ATP-binding cassette subfamily B protein
LSNCSGGPWRAYIRLFDGSRRLLAITVVVSILQGLLLVPVAALVARAFDRQIPRGNTGGVAATGALILVLYVASAGLGLFTRFVSLKVNKSAVTRLRVMLIERLYGLSRAELDRRSAGELQSIVVQDSERVDAMSNAIVALLLPAALIALGLSVVALALNPLLFAVLVAVVPVLILADRTLARVIRGRTRQWYRAFDAFASTTSLALRAMSLTKAHGAERVEIERRSQIVRELGAAGRQMAWAGGAYSIVQQSISACAGVVVLIVGGWSTARGDMTIGQLLGFYAIVALLLRQVTVIVTNVPVVLSGYESVVRLNTLLEIDDSEPYTGTRDIDFRGAVEFKGVSFSYDSRPVLRDVDLTIVPGEHVAIVGPNGAGKSTLGRLLLGLYRPQSGHVLADGIPLDELDMPRLRRSMGVVLQDPVIFPGTIAENIAYGRPGATEAEIRRAATWATAADFAEALPQGYATPVGDEGVLLSGGQCQRIAIARALLSRPALLILDEPTTYLDDAAISRLMDNLQSLPRSPTIIAISHDPEIAGWAERVVNLRDGQVVSGAAAALQTT